VTLTPPVSDQPLQHYYAARAAEYDRIYAKPERQEDLRAIERWLPPVFQHKSVIEIACGTGYWTQFLAKTARSILAVDAAPETLRIAAARVDQPGVAFVVGDAYRLPDAGSLHDAAFAGFWISHVPRARMVEFIDNLHARVAPGAKIVFLDNRFVAGSSTPIAERDADGNTYQTRVLEDGSRHRVLKNFLTREDLESSLEGRASAIRWHEWKHYWAVEYTSR